MLFYLLYVTTWKAEAMSLEYHFCEHSQVPDSYFEDCASHTLPNDSKDAKREDSLIYPVSVCFKNLLEFWCQLIKFLNSL